MSWSGRLFLMPTAAVALGAAALSCGFVKEFTQPTTLSIQKFVAAPGDITLGAATTLTWDVDGAETIEIDNGIGTVTASGTKPIRPEWTTTSTRAARWRSSPATAPGPGRVAPG